MPRQPILDGECWGTPSAVGVMMIAVSHPPKGYPLIAHAMWAARRLKAVLHLHTVCPEDALARWYYFHYQGGCHISMPVPIFVIEFPPIERMN